MFKKTYRLINKMDQRNNLCFNFNKYTSMHDIEGSTLIAVEVHSAAKHNKNIPDYSRQYIEPDLDMT